MRRLDTGAMPALGSGDTFRFLFSGTSVVTVIVWVEARLQKARSKFGELLNWRSLEACQLRFGETDRRDRIMCKWFPDAYSRGGAGSHTNHAHDCAASEPCFNLCFWLSGS
jgi:hypothetical protein